MTDDRFIAISARALIHHCGIEADFVAAARAHSKLARGDTDGADLWRRILQEVVRLQAMKRLGELN